MHLPTSLDYLRPLVLPDLIRLGRRHDGGYVVPRSAVEAADHLLSFGLNYDWSFETDFRRLHRLPIHAYDHTISAGSVLRRALTAWPGIELRNLPWLLWDSARYFRLLRHFPERVVAWPASPRDAPVPRIFARLPGARRVFLKMDIEGAEYEVIPALLAEADRLVAMVIEFHEVTARRAEFEACIAQLLARFEIVHLHGNNWGSVAPDGLPDVLEITFVPRTACPAGALRRQELPIPLDQPCHPGRPEIPLRFAPAGRGKPQATGTLPPPPGVSVT